MKTTLSTIGLVLALTLSAGVSRAQPVAVSTEPTPSSLDAPATFARLKGLVGEWKGSWEPGSEPTTVTYSLTGNGSVLREDYRIGETTMSTVYHMDGDELMLTHYCSIGNQPRMRAQSVSADGEIIFDFFDITNHDTGGYSKRLALRLVDDDRVSVAYTGSRTGRTSGVELDRVR